MVEVLCPVRGCGRPLAWGERALICPSGHTFDVARSGYANLLQPQDRRARAPGDPREAVLARRRTLERGLGAPLVEALVGGAGALPRSAASRAALDVGCGEGFFLAALAARAGLEGWGVDLSTPAADAAARAHPGQRWIVANADRRLPFGDGSFDIVLSINARQNVPELARLLAPAGRLLLAVPGADDLAELRAAVLGAALPLDRAAAALARFEPALALEARVAVRGRARLDPPALADLLAGSYRGARHRARDRIARLGDLDVTLSWDLLRFAHRRSPRG